MHMSYSIINYIYCVEFENRGSKYWFALTGLPNAQNHIVCAEFQDEISGKVAGNFCNIYDRTSVSRFTNSRLKKIGWQRADVKRENFKLFVEVRQGNSKFYIEAEYDWNYGINAVDFSIFSYDGDFYIGKGYVTPNVRDAKAVVEHFRKYITGLDLLSISRNPCDF